MKTFKKYPDTRQFRQIIRDIKKQASYKGQDENDKPIYDSVSDYPVIKAKASCKLHGTHLTIAYNNTSKLFCQKRSNIITPDNDNAGSAQFCHGKEKEFEIIFRQLSRYYNIDLDNNTIYLYAEWAGKGIQKSVAISESPKSVYIYACRVNPIDTEQDSFWIDIDMNFVSNINHRIFNVWHYKTWEFDIDFNNPEKANNEFIEITNEVENECPIAKEVWGVSGIGEGIVISFNYKNIRYCFKSKGEKHSAGSKVKVLKPIDEVRAKLLNDIAEKVTPVCRLNQGIDEVNDVINGNLLDVKKTGDVIRWVIKDIGGRIAKITKQYFFKRLDKESGL